VNISSKSQTRKRVRAAQNKANEARVERERQNATDTASFLVELSRLAAVDEWEQNRICDVRAEAERRRHEHREVGATALERMRGRGETLSAIAELAGVGVGELRAVLKAAGAQREARAGAIGAANGATAQSVSAPVGAAAQAESTSTAVTLGNRDRGE
jgi:hypothetical protein